MIIFKSSMGKGQCIGVRFMKKRNRLLLVFASILIGIVLIFTAARYGWRLFGFSMCDDMYIEVLDVGEEKVSFESDSGFPFGSDAFIGYKAEQTGDTLYIGVKFNMLLGVLPKDETSGFFSVPIDGQVNQIIQKGSNEKIIWDREGKDKFTLHMIVSGVDALMLGYCCYLGDEIVTQKKFTYENPDFPLEISKNDFPEDADLRQLRIEFFTIEEDSECKIGEFADFNVEWGQTYEALIIKKDGVYSLKY
jgi:hypothetical protein